MWDTKFHTQIEQQAKIMFPYILSFIFLDSKLEDRVFCSEW